ncbi:glycerol-3-phosphate dehydrogenase [NAD(+)], cytoplasmic isoform X4 [Emydura macquarii macquarii]|uniref:glycerol-3-phosphate dehydrogenase [NAD(+)], cytoplasmic isoform X4 n=1 Tax=Emydura macquarii macquarii TaxID=1129001 RepID=UPI00352B742A
MGGAGPDWLCRAGKAGHGRADEKEQPDPSQVLSCLLIPPPQRSGPGRGVACCRGGRGFLAGARAAPSCGCFKCSRRGGAGQSPPPRPRPTMGGRKVCIVGSGNWGSAIAKIVGSNAARLDQFDTTVTMWVFEEEVGGKKLTEIINTQHENIKYLPGHKLPSNVLHGAGPVSLQVAVPDLLKASAGADILIFVVPHQFIDKLCDQLKDHVRKETIGVSLIKGVDEGPEGLKLISDVIREWLGIEMSVLMGANIANEVAEEKFCETTIDRLPAGLRAVFSASVPAECVLLITEKYAS